MCRLYGQLVHRLLVLVISFKQFSIILQYTDMLIKNSDASCCLCIENDAPRIWCTCLLESTSVLGGLLYKFDKSCRTLYLLAMNALLRPMCCRRDCNTELA